MPVMGGIGYAAYSYALAVELFGPRLDVLAKLAQRGLRFELLAEISDAAHQGEQGLEGLLVGVAPHHVQHRGPDRRLDRPRVAGEKPRAGLADDVEVGGDPPVLADDEAGAETVAFAALRRNVQWRMRPDAARLHSGRRRMQHDGAT